MIATAMNVGYPDNSEDTHKSDHIYYIASFSVDMWSVPASMIVELPGHFLVWLASPDAAFLKNKSVWTNWDVKELKARPDILNDHELPSLCVG